MTSDDKQPFIGLQAFDWDTGVYVTFPSQPDAMLASLQLFHEIERDTMDLVFSVVNHQDFDSKQVTLHSSGDVDSVVERGGLEDGVADDYEGPLRPFVDFRALNQDTETYVTFCSRADAMLASLQLFHDVECYIIDIIFSVIAHPDFDSKQVTLRSWGDVMDVVEERRLKDRMAVVQKLERSSTSDGRIKQAGFPQFVLDEVLDIIHVERMDSIEARFEETLDERAMYYDSMHIKEDATLKAMTRVHRSWTFPSQKVLGRVLHIGRPIYKMMNVLLNPVRKSIFGPWTSVVAVQFFHPIEEIEGTYYSGCSCDNGWYGPTHYEYCEDVDYDEHRQWFETLHRMLVGFTNLKSVLIKSYAPDFTEWSNSMFGDLVRRNLHLEEVTLYAMEKDVTFDLDPLIGSAAILRNLRTLNVRGVSISVVAEGKVMQGAGFERLSNLTIERSFESIKHDLRVLFILSALSNPRLKSMLFIDALGRRSSFGEVIAQEFTNSQCASVFDQLCSLQIGSMEAEKRWLEWVGPYCSKL